MSNNRLKDVRSKTIEDFGEQWDIDGEWRDDYYSPPKIFQDYFGELFKPSELSNKVVCEVGSGSGRIVNMLSKYQPTKIYAVEPSKSIVHISKNNKDLKNLEILNVPGDKFTVKEKCDFIFSLGVIHHIKDPTDVIKNIKSNLKENGRFIMWVYGYENNVPYILVYKALSLFTKKLPNSLLYFFSGAMNCILQPYIWLCKFLPLPLKGYLLNVFAKCGWKEQKLIIFDQLNPCYAKYYKKQDVESLLQECGFSNIAYYHRHGYSWTVIAK